MAPSPAPDLGSSPQDSEPTVALPTEAARPTRELDSTEVPQEEEEADAEASFQIRSLEFAMGDPIPVAFTCDGEDTSPPLDWSGTPDGTESIALIVDDPDAPGGTWVHWLLYNIPADQNSLPAGIPARPELDNGSRHGENSWGRTDYGGPCPPSGTHRYFFKLYALDQRLDLTPGASKAELIEAMEGHILAQAEAFGTYTRGA